MIMTEVSIQHITTEQAKKSGHRKGLRFVYDPHHLLGEFDEGRVLVVEPAPEPVKITTFGGGGGGTNYVPAEVSTAALDAVTRSLADTQHRLDETEAARKDLADALELSERNNAELRRFVHTANDKVTEAEKSVRVLRNSTQRARVLTREISRRLERLEATVTPPPIVAHTIQAALEEDEEF